MKQETNTAELQPCNVTSARSKEVSLIRHNTTSQEIIDLSSDSEKEAPEPKICDNSLLKLRPSKRWSKYTPEDVQDRDFKENAGWLKKQYPSEFNNRSKPLNLSERICCPRTHVCLIG